MNTSNKSQPPSFGFDFGGCARANLLSRAKHLAIVQLNWINRANSLRLAQSMANCWRARNRDLATCVVGCAQRAQRKLAYNLLRLSVCISERFCARTSSSVECKLRHAHFQKHTNRMKINEQQASQVCLWAATNFKLVKNARAPSGPQIWICWLKGPLARATN